MKKRKPINFAIPGPTPVETVVTELASAFALRSGPAQEEQRAYYDTFDWRLYRAGYLLYARPNAACLETLATGRLQCSPLPPALPADPDLFGTDELPFKEKLIGIIKIRALIKRFESRVQILPARVLDRQEKTVARLVCHTHRPAIGAGQVLAAGLRLCPRRGYAAEARRVRDFLHTLGLHEAGAPVVVRALQAAGIMPGSGSEKQRITLTPGMRADAALKHILIALLETARQNETGILQDIDTEFLHDFRVAIRRTRSALSQLKNVLPGHITAPFRTAFAELAKATNTLRDLDVCLLSADRYRQRLPASFTGDIEPFFAYIETLRQAEFQKVGRLLRTAQYRKVVADWQAFLEISEPEPDLPRHAATPVLELATGVIRKRYRRVQKLGGRIQPGSPDADLHSLRITCKKLRYLLEFFSSLYAAAPLGRFVRQLKKLQDILGRLQDLRVQIDFLQSSAGKLHATGGGTHRTLLALGILIGVLEAEKRTLRDGFFTTFAAFRSRKNSQRFEALLRRPAERS